MRMRPVIRQARQGINAQHLADPLDLACIAMLVINDGQGEGCLVLGAQEACQQDRQALPG